MAIKRHTPERALERVVAALESDDTRTSDIARSLLRGGPLMVEEAQALVDAIPPDELPPLRGEMVALLRTLARDRNQGRFSAEVGLYHHLTFHLTSAGQSVGCAVNGGSPRDVVMLQLVLLLREVGFSRVRLCGAADCGRLFVKNYRREYCSPQCQHRVSVRRLRAADRDRKAYYARARRRTKDAQK